MHIFIEGKYCLCYIMKVRLSETGFGLILIILLWGCQTKQGTLTQKEKGRQNRAETISISTLAEGDTATIHKLIQKGLLSSTKDKHTDSAVAYYRKAFSLANQIGYSEGMAMAYNNLALLYRNRQDFSQANYYVAQLTAVKKQLPSRFHDENNRAHRFLALYEDYDKALAYYQSGRFDSATYHYLKVIKAAEPVDTLSSHMLALSYAALGVMYHYVQDSSRGMYYFDQSLTTARKFGHTQLLLLGLFNKANVLANSNNLEQGLILAKELFSTSQRIQSVNFEGLGAYQIAHCLIKLNQPDSALYYSKITLESALKLDDLKRIIEAHYLLGFNYNQLNQYKAAEQHLLAGLHATTDPDSFLLNQNAYAQLARTYERLGDYAQAFLYQKLYTTANDSLRGSENAKRISEIETKYRVAEKDRQLTQQQLKIAQQQKNLYLWLGGALLLVGVLIGLLRRNRHKAVVAQLSAKLAGEEQERARMAKELHDGIVSRLSVIKTHFSALPEYEEAGALKDAVGQLDQSIAELRSTAHNLLPDVLQHQGLAGAMEHYCAGISRAGELQVDFRLVGTLPQLDKSFQLNLYRIIQELLQNIRKHAGATRALVQFNVNGELLDITVDDNGKGQQAGTPTGQGMGLRNLKERVQLLEGRMETEHDQGTSVYLSFDMKKHKTA